MCNFYMMYYCDASSNIQTPEICGDQYTYASLFDSFPNGSDVALPSVPGHHHHHHHGHENNSDGETADNETADVVLDSEEPSPDENPKVTSDEQISTTPIMITDNDEVTTSDYVTSSEDDFTNDRSTFEATTPQHAREMATDVPRQKTTQFPPLKTSRSVAHDVTDDVTTSTSVSEQTTTPSEQTTTPSEQTTTPSEQTTTPSDVAPKKGFEYPRTTRSTEESKSSPASFQSDKRGQHSQVNSSQSEEGKVFNVSLVDAWPSSVTEGLGQVTGLAVDSAGRLFVFHRSERTWDFE